MKTPAREILDEERLRKSERLLEELADVRRDMSSWEELGALSYRSPALVGLLMGYLEEAEDPPRMVELVAEVGELAGERWVWATVEATVRDMAKVGIVEVFGKPRRGMTPDGRRVKVSVLGWAWWERRLLTVPADLEPEE